MAGSSSLREKKFRKRNEALMSGGAGAALCLAALVVHLQEAGLGGGPGSYDTEDDGQVHTGLADGLIGGGHQESSGDDHDQRDDDDQDVGIDVLHDSFLLEDEFLFSMLRCLAVVTT